MPDARIDTLSYCTIIVLNYYIICFCKKLGGVHPQEDLYFGPAPVRLLAGYRCDNAAQGEPRTPSRQMAQEGRGSVLLLIYIYILDMHVLTLGCLSENECCTLAASDAVGMYMHFIILSVFNLTLCRSTMALILCHCHYNSNAT